MSPRRRSRRGLAPFAPALIVSGLFLFLLIGGVLYIGQGSGPFHTSLDRSFAQQAGELARQSNDSGAVLRNLMQVMPRMGRASLQASLDSLVSDTATAAARADALTPPDPVGTAAASFAAAMTERAEAAAGLRGAVDGLLVLAPLEIVGAAPASGVAAESSGVTPRQLSAAAASKEITAMGALLQRSDRAYAATRHDLATGPGGARLVQSRWVQHAVVFGAGAVATLVDELDGSPDLAPNADVKLVAVRLNPPVVPPAPATPGQAAAPTTPGVSVLSPTNRLFVTAAVDNAGNVAEPRVTLTVTLQELPKGRPTTLRRNVSLAPGASVAVALPALSVRPGATYGLTVAITPPHSQSDRSAVSVPATLEIAPELGKAPS